MQPFSFQMQNIDCGNVDKTKSHSLISIHSSQFWNTVTVFSYLGPIMLRSAIILENLTFDQNGQLLGPGWLVWVLEKSQFLGLTYFGYIWTRAHCHSGLLV